MKLLNTTPSLRLLAGVGLLLCLPSCGLATPPEAKVSLRVVDEQGQPISGAKLTIFFHNESPEGASNYDHAKVVGMSDADGGFSATHTTTGEVFAIAEKAGCYETSGVAVDYSHHHTSAMGFWQPWNPTVIAELKKKVHPVPMYARNRADLDFPRGVENQPLGYDLLVGDWVAPYGKGTTADFVFHLTVRTTSSTDRAAELLITFSNLDDGILPYSKPKDLSMVSDLASPQVAPENGYLPSLSLKEGSTPTSYDPNRREDYSTSTDDDNYLIRIRSTRGPGGKIVSALYGKIYGRIRYDVDGWVQHSSGTGLQLTYYINPDNQSRSLEWDKEHNLCVGLPRFQWPGSP